MIQSYIGHFDPIMYWSLSSMIYWSERPAQSTRVFRGSLASDAPANAGSPRKPFWYFLAFLSFSLKILCLFLNCLFSLFSLEVPFDFLSALRSGHKTGKKPWPNRTLTEKDRKFSGLEKTVTAVRSSVFNISENPKTDKDRLVSVLTGLCRLEGPPRYVRGLLIIFH